MTINEARMIRELKKRCTYRRLAEIYYPEDDVAYGNQGFGEDLCKEALKLLYPDQNLWVNGGNWTDPIFVVDNISCSGNFGWWE